MKKIWIPIIVIIIIIVLIVVFYKPSPKGTIKIGAILPLSGKAASYGQWAKNGFDLAAEEVNSLRGYPYKLELIYEDDTGDPKTGVSAIQKLISVQNPPVIIGVILSRIAVACAPIAEQNRVVLLSTSASSDEIRNAGDYIFRVRESGIIHGQSMADYVWKKWSNSKKTGVLYLNAENGITYAEAFKKRFLELGGQIDLYEAYNVGETDFRTQLFKVKDKKIKILYVPGEVAEISQILKQAQELSLKIQFLSSVGAENPKLIEIAGSAAENLIYTYPAFNPDSSDEIVKQFTTKYSEKFGIKPEFIAANSYDAIKILAEVFKKYGYKSDQIKDGLYKIQNYDGVSGNLSFDEYGDVMKPIMFKTVKNGQFVPYTE
ncbi:MAG: ABC transporter substrate-binding protein [Patescibacteria group bacterium]